MLKVFLVEDEVVIRNGIKNSIPWEKEGFLFAGEASDGELAYPLIKKEKPDILITDIKMPFMDGLELSRLVKKELPNIKIIILSGYNEFDYAKMAISIGVTDYLLKPISSAKLLEAVKKIGKVIEQEQEQAKLLDRYQKEMEENTHLEKQCLWNLLVSKNLSTAELLENGQRLGMDFTASAYRVFLFKIMQSGDGTGYSEEVIEVSDRITEMSAQWEQVLTFDRGMEGWAFLIKGQDEEELTGHLKTYSRALQEAVQEYPDMEYFGGIGITVNRLRDVHTSYIEAAKAFSGRFFSKPNQILCHTDIMNLHTQNDEKIDVTNIRSRKSEQELVEKFLKNGTLEEVDGFLDEYFLNIGNKNCQSLLFRQYVVMNLYFAASDFLQNLGISMDRLPENCRDINAIVEEAVSVDAMKNHLSRLFTETINLRDSHSRKKYSVLLEEARAFIQENYQREDMSLNTVAAQVNISPSYFSAIFSGETGQTFVEYLTSVRLEKAKELLMCSSMRTAEIGYEVGYKDSHYFSYIFKKVVGCSPKDYKNRRKEEK
ncbi:MAG: response regulator [Candidatus Choladocola sp.]|nr:response regulator [Candidatus Choladocola sp.]